LPLIAQVSDITDELKHWQTLHVKADWSFKHGNE
jgi:hypothetical protein